MKILLHGFIVHCIGFLLAEELKDCYNITFPDLVSVKENVPQGHLVFSIDGDSFENTTSHQWTLISMKAYFDLTADGSSYKLKTSQSLDTLVTCIKEVTFTLQFQCSTKQQTTNILIQYVGKDNVLFNKKNLPKILTLEEETAIGTVFLNLTNDEYYVDTDCYNEHVISLLGPPGGETFDARRYIDVNLTSNVLYLTNELKYDEERCRIFSGGNLKLKMSVKDMTFPNPIGDFYTFDVVLVDIDDEPPVFIRQGCESCVRNCKVTSKNVDLDLKYDEYTYYRYQIPAKDFDTQDAILHYNIVTVDPEHYQDLFDFNLTNGELSINISANDLTNSTDFYGQKNIAIILQVSEAITSQTSDNMTIYLRATVTMETTTSVTTEATTESLITTESITTTDFITSTEHMTTDLQTTFDLTTFIETTTGDDSKISTEYVTSNVTFGYSTNPASLNPARSASQTGQDYKTIMIIVVCVCGIVTLLSLTGMLVFWRRAKNSDEAYTIA